MDNCVYVTQEGWGLIKKGCGVNKIGTFGCGPCIGVLLKNKNLVGCVHVSNKYLAKGIRSMLYIMMSLMNNNIEEDTTFLYLVGGQSNEKLKTKILSILFEEQFNLLKITMKKDNACIYPHVSNILAGFDIPDTREYIPTGYETINVFEIISKSYDENAKLTCCYSPEYLSTNYIIDYNYRKLLLTKRANLDMWEHNIFSKVLEIEIEKVTREDPAKTIRAIDTKRFYKQSLYKSKNNHKITNQQNNYHAKSKKYPIKLSK